MKKVILTFDYEVFLGKSGSIENCIISPTEKILELFKSLGIKGVFFIDILFFKRLTQEGLVEDYRKLVSNMQAIISAGSYLELHIHPHWLDAKFNHNELQWDLSNDKRYRFEALSLTEREHMFQECIGLLEKIGKEVNPKYKVNAYRAGGLCIQPFGIFKPFLKKYEIFIESSVGVGLKDDSETHKFDYRKVKEHNPYRFSNDPIVKEDKGDFIEFPMLTYKMSFVNKLILKLKGKSSINQIYGDGVALSSQNKRNSARFLDKFKSSVNLFSLDGDFYPDFLFKKLLSHPADVITIISHPKLMSQESLDFIKKISDSKKFSFSTFNEEFS